MTKTTMEETPVVYSAKHGRVRMMRNEGQMGFAAEFWCKRGMHMMTWWETFEEAKNVVVHSTRRTGTYSSTCRCGSAH